MTKPIKVKKAKAFTRMQAERAISSGLLPPESFLDISNPFAKKDPKAPTNTVNHGNYHVRAKAWFKMGCPVLDDPEQHKKFLASLHIKEKVVADEVVVEPEAQETV